MFGLICSGDMVPWRGGGSIVAPDCTALLDGLCGI
jgi:hypothetical protein